MVFIAMVNYGIKYHSRLPRTHHATVINHHGNMMTAVDWCQYSPR